MKAAATAEEKKNREAQAASYKKANWALVIKMNVNGGGAAKMMRRGN